MSGLGMRFVRGMQRTMRPWQDIPVDAAAVAEAARAGDEHKSSYASTRPVSDPA